MDKRRSKGRLRDSLQAPRRNRQRFLVKFWFSSKAALGLACAVEAPFEENLDKWIESVKDANADQWVRQKSVQVLLGLKDGKPHYEMAPVIDPKTGLPEMEHKLKRVTIRSLGADI